jgi:hypothetical protein
MGLIESSAQSGEDPVVSDCFRVGWSVEELLCQSEVPERHPRSYVAHLPEWIDLSPYDWRRLRLDQIEFAVGQVASKVGAHAAVSLDLTEEVRSKLTITRENGPMARYEEYRAALRQLDVNLLVTLTAARSSYGKAYGLGRALAAITRPNQEADQMVKSFGGKEIGRLYVWLDELASLLPDHAARAVAQSLDWWQQAVGPPAHEGSKLSYRKPSTYLNEQASPQPGPKRRALAVVLRHRQAHSAQADFPAIDELVPVVQRQGLLWRDVLDGDKLCTDLLTPQDYRRAGDRLAHNYSRLVGRVLRTMPWLLVLPFSLAAVIFVLWVIPGSEVARTATGIAALAGTLSGVWKAIWTRVTPIAVQLEGPLWGSELDTAAAEAVTIQPLGKPQDLALEFTLDKEYSDKGAATNSGQPDSSASAETSHIQFRAEVSASDGGPTGQAIEE